MRPTGLGLGLTLGSGRRYLPWLNHGGPSTWPLVLLADRGGTTVDATVLDPYNVSTANWSPINLSARTEDTITDTSDAGSVQHILRQTITSLVATKPASVAAELKAGTKGYALVNFGGSYGSVNLSTGATTAEGGLAIATIPLSGGWWQVSASTTVGNNTLGIYIETTMGGHTYQGDGTGTILVRNITVTQRNVSAWADVVTGNGLSAIQATSLRQGIWVPSSATFGGQPCIDFSAGGGMSVAGFVRSNTQPFTLYAVFAKSGSAYGYAFDGATTRYGTYCNNTAYTVFGTAGSSSCSDTVTSRRLLTIKTTNPAEVWTDGVKRSSSGPITYGGIDTLMIGQRNDAYPSSDLLAPWAALLIHDGIDDDPTTLRVSGWVKQRFGI